VARRATKVKQERQAGQPVLLLDAGDALASDRPRAGQKSAEIIIAAMNLMKYDAMAVGGRDLSLGAEALSQLKAEAEFPFLSANVILTKTGELFAEPYLIKDIGGHRIGILGLTAADASNAPDFSVYDPLEVAHRYLPELSRQADVVIVLSNLGTTLDQQLVTEFPQVDLIIGGRPTARPKQALRVEGSQAFILIAEKPSIGHAGRFLGIAHLQIDGEGNITECQWQTKALSPDVADDPEMRALLKQASGPGSATGR